MHSNLSNINHWIFDLDNTLYPASLGIIEQARDAVMSYMEDRLSLTVEETKDLYKELHKGHHSVLRGLMKQYHLDPKEIFDSLKTLDISHVSADNQLSDILATLPGKKIIFTNATASHAENMLNALDIRQHFDHIYDIETAGYIPKPQPETYQNLCERFKISPEKAIYFEDVPRNLEPAHAMGMTTVFVRHNDDTKEAREDYIHHYMDDISEGLLALIQKGQ